MTHFRKVRDREDEISINIPKDILDYMDLLDEDGRLEDDTWGVVKLDPVDDSITIEVGDEEPTAKSPKRRAIADGGTKSE